MKVLMSYRREGPQHPPKKTDYKFERGFTLDGKGTLTLEVVTCEGSCRSCMIPKDMVKAGLAASGTLHEWRDEQSVTFPETGATNREGALEFLLKALPTAMNIELMH